MSCSCGCTGAASGAVFSPPPAWKQTTVDDGVACGSAGKASPSPSQPGRAPASMRTRKGGCGCGGGGLPIWVWLVGALVAWWLIGKVA
jgi:hypothetical protein